MTMYAMVKEFHEVFGHPVDVQPSLPLLKLRFDLHAEEHNEVAEELAALSTTYDPIIQNLHKIQLTKEICDNIVVLLGTAVALGLPIDEAFAEVHRSNMSKLGEDGKPILREDGKILKGPNYKEADIGKLF